MNTIKTFWLSSNRMTVKVLVALDEYDRIIVLDTAPILYKFTGQPISNLIGWMKKQGGFKYSEII